MEFGTIFRTLIATLVIFHLPVIFKIQGKKFWIVCDYFWIILSLIGVSLMNYDAVSVKQKGIIENNISIIEWNYKDMYNSAKNRRGQLSKDTLHENASIYKSRGDFEYIKALDSFYDSLYIILEANYKPIMEEKKYELLPAIKSYVDSNPSHSHKFIYNFKESIEKSIGHAVVAFQENNEVEAKIVSNESDKKILKFFGPFLLAIGIGIRISKVSAQLRGIA